MRMFFLLQFKRLYKIFRQDWIEANVRISNEIDFSDKY